MDIEYWNAYYDSHGEPFDASDFAKYAIRYIDEGDSLIDLGCGNGRDTIYFGQNAIFGVGVDQCPNIVNALNTACYDNVRFESGDFTNRASADIGFDHAYSRFTLHSITEEEEDRLIKWASENINKKFFIETRSDKDSLVGKSTDHYRRFINMDALICKLIANGFSIKYAELARGFSKYDSKFEVDYNEDDPMLIRIVAEKMYD